MEISKINAINDQFENNEQLSNNDKLHMMENLYGICLTIEEPSVKARTFSNYAIALFYNGELDKSHKLAIETIEIVNAENLVVTKIRVSNLLGNINSYLGRYAIALDYYLQSLRLSKQMDKSNSLGGLLNNIAIIYSMMKMKERTLYYYEEAQKFSKQEHNYKVYFLTTYNLITEYLKNGEFDHAKGHANAFYEMLTIKRDILQYEALWQLIKGKIAHHKGDLDEALENIHEASALFIADDDISGINDCDLMISRIMLDSGKYDLALEYSLKVANYAMHAEDVEIEREARLLVHLIADHVAFNEAIKDNYKRLLMLDEKLLANLYALSMYQIDEKLDIELKNEMQQMTERLLENMRFIYEISKDISKEQEYEMLVELIIRKLISFMKFDALVIGLLDSEQSMIVNRIVYHKGQIEKSYDVPIDNKGSLGTWVVRNNREYYTGSLTHMKLDDYEPYKENFPGIDVPYETIYYTPLVTDREIIGVFSLQMYEINGFDRYQLDMIRAIASYIAIAVANALKTQKMKALNEQLSIISKFDGLSNLLNRYALNEDIKPLLKAYNADKKCIATLMCDIDYFKEYNDFYGHVEGDRIIQKISAILKESAEHLTPYIYRYGGDEFLIIFQEQDEKVVTKIAHDLLKAVDDANMPHVDKGIGQRVTLSIGLAFFEIKEDPAVDEFLDEDDLLRGADISLYVSKRKGRNQVRRTLF